jgi:hypothetical protein
LTWAELSEEIAVIGVVVIVVVTSINISMALIQVFVRVGVGEMVVAVGEMLAVICCVNIGGWNCQRTQYQDEQDKCAAKGRWARKHGSFLVARLIDNFSYQIVKNLSIPSPAFPAA